MRDTRERFRILTVDDRAYLRQGITASLNVEPDPELVAEASNGKAEALSA